MRPQPVKESRSEMLAVTAEQAARLLSISRSKVYELMHSGNLAYFKLGKSRRIVVADILKLIELNKQAG